MDRRKDIIQENNKTVLKDFDPIACKFKCSWTKITPTEENDYSDKRFVIDRNCKEHVRWFLELEN